MPKDRICILFNEVPEGTHFTKGCYSWVNASDGRAYIRAGVGDEYDPEKKKLKREFKKKKIESDGGERSGDQPS